MPCVGCGKECKCTPEKCSESCKCQTPGQCGCHTANTSSSSGGCCKKGSSSEAGGDTTQGKCCGDKK